MKRAIAGIHTVGAWVRVRVLYNQKEHTELYKIFKFRVNWANIKQDTAIQKLQDLQRNVWISGQVSSNPYICYCLQNV